MPKTLQEKMKQKWLRLDWENGWQIVVPESDIKAHGFPKDKATEVELASFDCPCKPRITPDKIIVHNSFEDMERVNQALLCLCENIDFGTYENTVGMVLPFDLPEMEKKKGDIVTIDTCIASEIGYLWHNGVRTLNSCCGHKKLEPSVVVTENSVEKMLELGYKHSAMKSASPKQTFLLQLDKSKNN